MQKDKLSCKTRDKRKNKAIFSYFNYNKALF